MLAVLRLQKSPSKEALELANKVAGLDLYQNLSKVAPDPAQMAAGVNSYGGPTHVASQLAYLAEHLSLHWSFSKIAPSHYSQVHNPNYLQQM